MINHFKYILVGGIIMVILFIIGLCINYIITNYPLICMGIVVITAFTSIAWLIGKGLLKSDYEIND
jgi:hypothetical protein